MDLKTSILSNETSNKIHTKEELQKIISFLDGLSAAADLGSNLKFIKYCKKIYLLNLTIK